MPVRSGVYCPDIRESKEPVSVKEAERAFSSPAPESERRKYLNNLTGALTHLLIVRKWKEEYENIVYQFGER